MVLVVVAAMKLILCLQLSNCLHQVWPWQPLASRQSIDWWWSLSSGPVIVVSLSVTSDGAHRRNCRSPSSSSLLLVYCHLSHFCSLRHVKIYVSVLTIAIINGALYPSQVDDATSCVFYSKADADATVATAAAAIAGSFAAAAAATTILYSHKTCLMTIINYIKYTSGGWWYEMTIMTMKMSKRKKDEQDDEKLIKLAWNQL